MRDNIKVRANVIPIVAMATVVGFNSLDSLLPVTAYGNDNKKTEITEKFDPSVSVKAKTDEVGLESNGVAYSKSADDSENILKKQLVVLRDEKLNSEIKVQREQTAKQAQIAMANQLNNESAIKIRLQQIKQAEEALKKKEAEAIAAKKAAEEAKRLAEEAKRLAEIEASKMVIKSVADAKKVDIRTKSNWTAEDFYAVLPDAIKPVVPVAIQMEQEIGVNALYLVCVSINEVGWGKHMSGDYNYYNWSYDGKNSINFTSIEHFAKFSIDNYRRKYIKPNWYINSWGKRPEAITLDVVNTKYAFDPDGNVLTDWSKVISEVMVQLSDRRLALKK